MTVFVIIAGFGFSCYDPIEPTNDNPTGSTNADTNTADSDTTETHPDEV